MITASTPKEHLRDRLPMKKAGIVTNIELYHKMIQGILKKQIVSAVAGSKNNLEDDLRKALTSLWQDAYSQGLAHMDKMHHKIDKESGNER